MNTKQVRNAPIITTQFKVILIIAVLWSGSLFNCIGLLGSLDWGSAESNSSALGLFLGTLGQSGDGPSKVEFAYQVNPELISTVGAFFHKKLNFPEVREFTDLSSVKLNRALEKNEQGVYDGNLFVLDAKMGNILYTLGIKGLDVSSQAEFLSAKQLAVTPAGTLGIIDASDRINLCFYFNGNTILKKNSCVATNISAKKIVAYQNDEFFALKTDGSITNLNNQGAETSPGLPSLNNVYHIFATRDHLYVIYDRGLSIKSFLNLPAFGQKFNYILEKQKSDITLSVLVDGVVEQSPPVRITDIAINTRGKFYAISLSHNMLIHLDQNFSPLKYFSFPSLPRPLRSMQNLKAMAFYPESNLIHILSESAIGVYIEEHLYDASVRNPDRYLPEGLLPVLESISKIDPDNFEPAKDLLTYPEVAPVLEREMNNLILQ